jgi:hypothetical protein
MRKVTITPRPLSPGEQSELARMQALEAERQARSPGRRTDRNTTPMKPSRFRYAEVQRTADNV